MALSRSTPLRAKTWCRRCGRSLCTCGEPPKLKRSPLPPVNRDRKAKRAAEDRVYGSYHRWIGTLPCILWEHEDHMCRPGTVAGHHLVPVKRGGEDYGNEVPMCQIAHTRSPVSVHRIGAWAFEEQWDVDLNLIAAGLAERYEREHGEGS